MYRPHLGIWARYRFTNLEVNSDPNSGPHLVKAKESAQPLLEALEKYRADHDLCPPTLEQLTGTYLPSHGRLRPFRYSARHEDWVFKSDACVAREKSLRGQGVKAKDYRREVTEFKLECTTGYHHYQLQSDDFPQDAPIPSIKRSIERWAYYDSQTSQWSLGWCLHTSHPGTGGQDTSVNGVCRWRDGWKSDPL